MVGRMKKINLKMKALEWSQHFSHYKSLMIFPAAQEQLTHMSSVGSCQISKQSKILWLSLLPAKNKEEPIKSEGARVVTRFICCHGNQSSDPI